MCETFFSLCRVVNAQIAAVDCRLMTREKWELKIIVVSAGSMHGIDVHETGKMYCLEVMQPNDMFAELVRAGMPAGGLLDDDLCILIASGCA